jgi:hypothetical protein
MKEIYNKNGNFSEADIDSAKREELNKMEIQILKDITNMEGQIDLYQTRCGSFNYDDEWAAKVKLAIKMQKILLKKIEQRRNQIDNFYVNFYHTMKEALQEDEFINILKITNERIFGRTGSHN